LFQTPNEIRPGKERRPFDQIIPLSKEIRAEEKVSDVEMSHEREIFSVQSY